jgi:SAM-dependent methyltransferase
MPENSGASQRNACAMRPAEALLASKRRPNGRPVTTMPDAPGGPVPDAPGGPVAGAPADPACANPDQAVEWDGPAGEHRTRHAAVFDAEARPHNERFRAAAGVSPRDRVLDVGCGTGQTTRDAARAAAAGCALGVDLSAQMLDHARRLSREEGLTNIGFQQADAQVHRFPAGSFDVCISRFGAMFFADPVAAFGNIGAALAPGGRLVLMVWQARDRNEWSTAVREALAGDNDVPPPPASGPHPFSLADPAVARGILTAAGFSGVGFTDVHEPVFYGPDNAVAFDVVRGLRSTRDLLAVLGDGRAEQALERLRATLAAHETGDGVFFDAHTWIITARRP